MAIVGAGYTGLNAALEIAAGGRRVVVLDALMPGGGCSSRNGGQVSPEVEYVPGALAQKYGAALGSALKAEGHQSVDWLENFLNSKRIACDFARSGHYLAAHTPSAFAALANHAKALEGDVVTPSEQRRELGTDAYYGGLVQPKHAALDPAKYITGLLNVLRDAGGHVVGKCRVLDIRRDTKGFTLLTAKGAVKARDVVMATNGYSGALMPWVSRRIIPIGSYVIATEPLDPALIDEVFPTGRTVTDTRKVIYYYRASPDRRRVVFGGRVSSSETDTRKSAGKLQAEMTRLFPQLSHAKISHSWMGYVAYTFDELPRTGLKDGVHFSLGYCGSGVAMASYLGMRLGQRVLGNPAGKTPFEDLSHPTRPLYTGRAWFLPAAVAGYRALDRLQIWAAGR